MGKLAKKLGKQFPELALLAVAGGEGAEKLAVFAHVPDGHAVGPAPGWLNAALAPYLNSEGVRREAATKIFGGSLPPWWTAADQLPNSRISEGRIGDPDLVGY